jgi:hypothetical protein
VCVRRRPRTPVSGARRPPARRPSTSPRRGRRTAVARRHGRRRDRPVGGQQQLTLGGGIELPDHVGLVTLRCHPFPVDVLGSRGNGCRLVCEMRCFPAPVAWNSAKRFRLRKRRERFSNLAVTAVSARCSGEGRGRSLRRRTACEPVDGRGPRRHANRDDGRVGRAAAPPTTAVAGSASFIEALGSC